MADIRVFAGATGMVNSTAVPLSDGRWFVVDTGGTKEDGQQFASEVARLGGAAFVFNTHEHGDHTQGNAFFSCPIISSITALGVMREQQMALGLPNIAFSERLELQLGEPLIIRLMGGHCPGVASLYWPERKLLFTGDLVFNGRMPWMGQADFALWIANLEEMLGWDVATVVPGHGPVGGKEILEQQRDYLLGFQKRVKTLASAGQNEELIYAELLAAYPVPERWHQMLRQAVKQALV